MTNSDRFIECMQSLLGLLIYSYLFILFQRSNHKVAVVDASLSTNLRWCQEELEVDLGLERHFIILDEDM